MEQQQFLAVAGLHRHPPTLEERVRTRALRLAASKAALRRAAGRLAGGAAALRAQEAVENRFLGDLAQLRRRWRLARHGGEGERQRGRGRRAAGPSKPSLHAARKKASILIHRSAAPCSRPYHQLGPPGRPCALPAAAGMFYADISLPLRGPAGQGITQEGAQCNLIMASRLSAASKGRGKAGWGLGAPPSQPSLARAATAGAGRQLSQMQSCCGPTSPPHPRQSRLQDTNGDACIVESSGAARHAVRGWRHISAVLAAKQRLLAWQALRQMVAAAARQQRHEADPDGAVAAVQRLVATAAAACQAATHAAVASDGGSDESAAMEVDAQGSLLGAADSRPAAGLAPLPVLRGSSGGSGDPMLSSAAKDILAAEALPGFQQQFEARALQLLAALLPGGSATSGGGGTVAAPASGVSAAQHALLDALLRWLRHAALCHRVQASLRTWACAAPGRAVQCLDSGEEFAAVWQLLGCSTAGQAPVLAIAVDDRLRLEGVSGEAGAPTHARGLTRPEFDRLLQRL